jgi:methyl-accepting chemotaxis protein
MSNNAAAPVLREDSLLNCWDYMKCAREETCPAYPNFGRACFAVTGTLCKGKEQGSYALKISRCRSCGFYTQLMGGTE